MRVSHALLSTAVALLAAGADVTSADGAARVATTATPILSESEVFKQELPIKFGNYTGTMVITIDPSTFHKDQDDSGSAELVDLTLSKYSSEERALFGSSLLERLVLAFNGWAGLWTWLKPVV